MLRLFICAGIALACSSEPSGPTPEPVSQAGASSDGGAGIGGATGAEGGAGGESSEGGAAGSEATDGGSGGAVELGGGAGGSLSLGGAGGTAEAGSGGSGSGPVSAWLAPCDPETCDAAGFPICALLSVAEGEPAEKLCTFECDGVDAEDACAELGGQCQGGGAFLMFCGPTL
jgi:hypothetical protein